MYPENTEFGESVIRTAGDGSDPVVVEAVELAIRAFKESHPDVEWEEDPHLVVGPLMFMNNTVRPVGWYGRTKEPLFL